AYYPDWPGRPPKPTEQQVTLDDHSKVVPPLPIPNRTVKRLCADDSWHSPVKVGHRQALTPQSPCIRSDPGALSLGRATLLRSRSTLPQRFPTAHRRSTSTLYITAIHLR